MQHLDFLDEHEKDVFNTAFELDQRWVVELSADRAPLISQAQSVNVFIPADIHKKDLHQIHYQAWKQGLKSLYYCRSKSIQRAEVVATKFDQPAKDAVATNGIPSPDDIKIPLVAAVQQSEETDYDECLSCQ